MACSMPGRISAGIRDCYKSDNAGVCAAHVLESYTIEDKALLAHLSQQYGLTQIDVIRHLLHLAAQDGIHLGGTQMEPTSAIPSGPALLRMLFAAAAASPRAGLNRTQRAAIQVSLQDEAWCPQEREIPETWERVMTWYAQEMERPARKEIQA